MAKVFHRERALGVHPKLLRLLDDWETQGPFDLGVGVDGGVRWDEALQARLFAEGRSKAKTLADTPHGRGYALDCYPAELSPSGKVRYCLESLDVRWWALGDFAEKRGLVWGGRWRRFRDRPHVEVPGWRNAPMPRKP